MIYIHIPFCRSFCTYCGFYSLIASKSCKNDSIMQLYTELLIREIENRAGEIRETMGTDTLYIGGGTPSVLPLDLLERVVAATEKVCGKRGFGEFTIEVNPEDIIEKGCSYVERLLNLGVNRISMGIQSFDDRVLHLMNRRHNAEEAVKAYGILENSGCRNISIDLIFGLSWLSDEEWENTIDKALRLGHQKPQHISAYQLSIEEGSGLEKLIAQGKYTEAGEEQCRRQYEILCKRLNQAGYNHYEVSNFALPGHEAIHNSAYWERVPYTGIGAGAHSFHACKDEDTIQTRSWNSELSDNKYTSTEELLNEEDIAIETIMLGLRTAKGITKDYLSGHCPHDILERMLHDGRLAEVPDRGRIRIPEEHFFISDEIIRELI